MAHGCGQCLKCYSLVQPVLLHGKISCPVCLWGMALEEPYDGLTLWGTTPI